LFVQDLTWVPTLTGLKVTDPNKVHALTFLHSITDSVHRFYICRHIACRTFSLNTHWVKNKWDSKFRCPNCGERYWPARKQAGYMKASHIYVLENTKKTDEPPTYILAEWPETADENWALQMMEAQANLTVDDNLKSEQELITDIASLVVNHAQRFRFEQRQLTAEAKYVVDEAKKVQFKEEWTYEHLLNGFPAAQIPEYDPVNTPVLAGGDLIRVIALSGLLQRKASSRL
jgi:hypothetical protein